MRTAWTGEAGFRPSFADRWRAISRRTRLASLLLLATLAGWSTFEFYRWCTAWPVRLVLRSKQGHHPIAFSPDGSTLITREFWGGEYLLWDQKGVPGPSKWPDGKQASWFSLGALSPDGKVFGSPRIAKIAGKNFSVALLDVGSGTIRSSVESPEAGCVGLRFLGDGKLLRLVVAGTGPVKVVDVDVATGQVVATRPVAVPGSTFFLGFSALSDDGQYLVVAGVAGSTTRATVWDLDRDREAVRLTSSTLMPPPERAALSSRSNRVALSGADGSIEIWDLATGRLRTTSREHRRGFRTAGLNFSPDGLILASSGEFRSLTPSFGLARTAYRHLFREPNAAPVSELILLDSDDGRPLLHESEFGVVIFSADGRSLATSHEDGAVRVHDAPRRR